MHIIGILSNHFYKANGIITINYTSEIGRDYAILRSNSKLILLGLQQSNSGLEYSRRFSSRKMSLPVHMQNKAYYMAFTYLVQDRKRKAANKSEFPWLRNETIIVPSCTYESIAPKSISHVEQATILYFVLNSIFLRNPETQSIGEIKEIKNVMSFNMNTYYLYPDEDIVYKTINTKNQLFSSNKISFYKKNLDKFMVSKKISFPLFVDSNHYAELENRIKNSALYLRDYYSSIKCSVNETHFEKNRINIDVTDINFTMVAERDLNALTGKISLSQFLSPAYWVYLFLFKIATDENIISNSYRDKYSEINIDRSSFTVVQYTRHIPTLYNPNMDKFKQCMGITLFSYKFNFGGISPLKTFLIIYLTSAPERLQSYLETLREDELLNVICKEINGKKPNIVVYDIFENEPQLYIVLTI